MTITPLEVHSAAVLKNTPKVRKMCAEDWSYVDRFEKPQRLWRPRGKRIEVARALIPTKQKIGIGGVLMPHETTAKPRTDEQARWTDEVYERIAAERSFVAQAPTGFGKTVCTLMALMRSNRKALIVVPKTDLMDQWQEAILEHTDIVEASIGIIRENQCISLGRPIVLGMLQSLAMREYDPEEFAAFGIVVFDEVHRIAADLMQEVCWKLPARVRVGLSATPTRKDGRFRTIRAHIGPVEVVTEERTMRFRVIRYATKWRAPKRLAEDLETGERTVEVIPHSPGRTAHITRTFKSSKKRVRLVARLTDAAYRRGRKTVVFFDTVAHLQTVALALHDDFKVPTKDVGHYIGGTDKGPKRRARLRTAAKKPIMLATYKMLSEGTDIPTLDTAVLADPRADVEQTVGRILRKQKGKKRPVVFDLVDKDLPLFVGYAKARRRWYDSVGAEVRNRALK